jgi:hypothetical protein
MYAVDEGVDMMEGPAAAVVVHECLEPIVSLKIDSTSISAKKSLRVCFA